MDISSYEKEGFKIISLLGRIDSTTSTDFGDWVEKYINPPTSNLILDCSGVDYISSAGLRVILNVMKMTKQHEFVFSICTPQEHVRELLDISGFASLIPVYQSLEDCITRT